VTLESVPNPLNKEDSFFKKILAEEMQKCGRILMGLRRDPDVKGQSRWTITFTCSGETLVVQASPPIEIVMNCRNSDEEMYRDFALWIVNNVLNPPAVPRGYHLTDIPKGVLGNLSKIREELEEAEDAAAQGVVLMELIELSDLYGALKARVERLGHTIEDLAKMSAVTVRAFQSGRR
jgi:hypothetical protein